MEQSHAKIHGVEFGHNTNTTLKGILNIKTYQTTLTSAVPMLLEFSQSQAAATSKTLVFFEVTAHIRTHWCNTLELSMP